MRIAAPSSPVRARKPKLIAPRPRHEARYSGGRAVAMPVSARCRQTNLRPPFRLSASSARSVGLCIFATVSSGPGAPALPRETSRCSVVAGSDERAGIVIGGISVGDDACADLPRRRLWRAEFHRLRVRRCLRLSLRCRGIDKLCGHICNRHFAVRDQCDRRPSTNDLTPAVLGRIDSGPECCRPRRIV